MKIKNQNKNLKFLVSIGNESDAQTYDALCSSSESINQFIDSIVDIVQLYELDGVNFNFKFDLDEQEAGLSFLFKQNLMQMLRVSDRQRCEIALIFIEQLLVRAAISR